MILNRQFIKEILKTSVAVLFILISIFLVIRMVAFLKQAAQGNIPLDSIFILLAFKLMTYIDIILPLILYISTLLVLNRWNRDNEMAVISASGISLINFVKPGAVLGTIFLCLVAWFSLDIAPWAVRKGIDLEDNFKKTKDLTAIQAGVFTELKGGKGTYFIERLDNDSNQFEDVFAYSKLPEQELIVVGEYAYRYANTEFNAEYLVIKNGTRYDLDANEAGYKITDFDEYALLIKPLATQTISYPIKGYKTAYLLLDPNPLGKIEFVWRMSKIVVVPILMIFAIAFSRVEVRRGKMGNMLIAFFMYFIYTNANTFVIAMLKKGTIVSSAPLWLMHGLFLLLALYCLFRSANNRSILPSFSR